jgi:murein DD-endopeptidase MepM/ murein hydrolase activator NlpD
MLQPPYGKPWLLYGILGCSLALNLVLALDRDDPTLPAEAAVAPVAPSAQVEASPVAEVAAAPTGASPAPMVDEEMPVVPRDVAADAAQWNIATGKVSSTLSSTFRAAVGDDGSALSAVYSRLFVWDLDLRRDLRKGDRIDVAWNRAPDDTIEVLAARLHSSKHGRTFAAYRWQAPGDAFTSYWQEDGTEVPYRLQNPPLRDYQQITSLLKDRPTHQGMDFKAPVGTPVVAPFDAQVTRANWNWKSNGNCVELRYPDGAMAKFLHLSEHRVEPGDTVKAGDIIALVGNTGRSTAPHLHYQVEVGSKIVDPLEYHGTVRRKVQGSSMGSLQKEIARQDAVLGQGLASR